MYAVVPLQTSLPLASFFTTVVAVQSYSRFSFMTVPATMAATFGFQALTSRPPSTGCDALPARSVDGFIARPLSLWLIGDFIRGRRR